MTTLSADPRRIALFAGLGSLALIAGALGFQYLGGIVPCEMCHWQRWPHIAAALLGIVLAPLLNANRRLAMVLVAALLLIGLLAAYSGGMLNVWQAQLLAVVVAALFVSSLWTPDTRGLVWVVIALMAVSGLIGLYQTGTQLHLLRGPASCTGHRFVLGSNMVSDVQCDVVSWSLFGLSLAAYNAIFSFLIAGAAGFALLKKSP